MNNYIAIFFICLFYSCSNSEHNQFITNLTARDINYIQKEITSPQLINTNFDTLFVKNLNEYTLKLYGNKIPGSVNDNKLLLKVYNKDKLIYTSMFLHPYSFPNFEVLNTNPLVIYWDEVSDWGSGVFEKQRCFLVEDIDTKKLIVKHFIYHSSSRNMCDYFVKIELQESYVKNNILFMDYLFELSDLNNKNDIKKKFEVDLKTDKVITDNKVILDPPIFHKKNFLPCDKISYNNFKNSITKY
jgi:hypothetical protein